MKAAFYVFFPAVLLAAAGPAMASTACLQQLALSSQGMPTLTCTPGDPKCLSQPPVVLFIAYPRSMLTRFFSEGLTLPQVGLALLPSVASPSRDGGRLVYRCEATNAKVGLFRCLDVQAPSADPIMSRVLADGLPRVTSFSRVGYQIYRPDDFTQLKNQVVCNTKLASVQIQAYAFGPVVRTTPSSDAALLLREHTADYVMRVELLDFNLSSFQARNQKPAKRFGWSIDPNAVAPLIQNLF